MIRNFKLAIIIIIAYALQTTIISDFNILGMTPDLFLVCTCGIAFLFGSTIGGVFGFTFGVLLDIAFGRAIGLNAFLGMHIGIILGQFNKRFFKDNYIVAIAFTGITTIVFDTFIYFFRVLIYNQSFQFGAFFVNIMLAVLLNIIAAIVIYPILLKINIGVELDRNIFGR